MKYIINSFLLISLFFSSCGDMETVIDLDVPPHEPVLVLNGIFDSDTIAQVSVSHSSGAFSSAVPAFIQNANVSLYKGGVFVENLIADMTDLIYVDYIDNSYNMNSLAMYYYKGNSLLEEGAEYRVDVSHSDYDPISAETYIPLDLTVYNIDIDSVSNEDKISLMFTFTDNPNQQNYYHIKSYSCNKEFGDEYEYEYEYEDEYEYSVGFMSNDPSFPGSIPNQQGYTFEGDNVLFTDALFNGEQKTIMLDLYKKGCDTVIIRLAHISKDTYSYYNSLDDHSGKGELGVFGGEVIPVYSNVQNGLGVLTSINSRNIYLKP